MRTQADFREMVEKRRLTHADEIYHEWVEQLFKKRDDLNAELIKYQNWAALEIGDLRAQLSQRRDFTLTARSYGSSGQRWFVDDVDGFVAYCLSETDAKALERWSREAAKTEPPLYTDSMGRSMCIHDIPLPMSCSQCLESAPKPPAPDLAAQVAFDELKAALDKWPKTRGSYFVADAIRQLIDAIIKAAKLKP